VLYVDLSVRKSNICSAIDANGNHICAKNVGGSTMIKFLQNFNYCILEITLQLKRDGLLQNLHVDDQTFLTQKRLADSEWPVKKNRSRRKEIEFDTRTR